MIENSRTESEKCRHVSLTLLEETSLTKASFFEVLFLMSFVFRALQSSTKIKIFGRLDCQKFFYLLTLVALTLLTPKEQAQGNLKRPWHEIIQ